MSLRVVIAGAAGRMGRHLVSNILKSSDMTLSGATERHGSEFLGRDAAAVAGLEPCGVHIVEDIKPLLESADAIIDFSTGSVVENARMASAAGCSVVIGTTAIGDEASRIFSEMASSGAKIVYASNFSVGVNLLFHISRQVSAILAEDFDVEIVELHHNQKKDSPSGTAIRLAEVIAEARGMSYSTHTRHGREGLVGVRPKMEIGMHAVRAGDIVGEHTAIFASSGERMELTHKASSRDTFAKGALRAVRFLKDAKPGLYDMQDVLGLK